MCQCDLGFFFFFIWWLRWVVLGGLLRCSGWDGSQGPGCVGQSGQICMVYADRCLGYCLCCAADWWMFWLCTAVHGGLRGQENNGWPCSSVVVLESSHLTHHSGSVKFCKLLC